MTDQITPVQVEQQLAWLADQIGRGVPVVGKAEGEYTTLKLHYDREHAKLMGTLEGSEASKKTRADRELAQEKADMEIAKVAFRHAQRQLDALNSRLSAWQSISKSVLASFGASTGRGR